MKKGYLTVVGGLLFASWYAHATSDVSDLYDTVTGKTYVQYEHDYQWTRRRHSDSIKIVHTTPKNFHYELKFGMYPDDNDYLFKNEYSGSGGLVLQYTSYLNKKTYLTPSFETDFMDVGMQYIAGATLYRKLNNKWGAYIRYRYQYRRYGRADRMGTKTVGGSEITYRKKADTGTHRFEYGIDYRLNANWRFQYIGLYDYIYSVHGAQSCSSSSCTDVKSYMYNNKHGYYYSEVKVQYYGWYKTHHFIPYFEVDQKSGSSSAPKQDAVLELGANIYF